MTLPSRFWADLRSDDFAALQASGQARRVIAVLPVAATEQHGPHLSLSVDTVLAEGVLHEALGQLPPDLPVLVLPTQSVGLSPEHAAYPGTLTLKNETVLRLWTDIGESVAAAGVHKLVLFNAHGGNVAVMDMVARDLRARLGMLVYSVSWFNLPMTDAQGQDVSALFAHEEHRFGIHAGAIETSMMLALAPERVQMAAARDFASAAQARAAGLAVLGNGRSAKLAWQIQDYNPSGAVGNAAAASADKGRMLLEASGRGLCALLAEIDQLGADTVRSR